MDDLISRATALEVIEAVKNVSWSQSEKVLCGKMYSQIKDLPAVDAVPVVHGQWVKVHGFCTPGGDPVWRCSVCGKGMHVYGIEHGSYGADIADSQWGACPNCGAKMDGET